MNAKPRIVTPIAPPEVLNFPEPPTLKDLLTTEYKPTPGFDKKKEEKPSVVSPLFSFMTVEDPPLDSPLLLDEVLFPEELPDTLTEVAPSPVPSPECTEVTEPEPLEANHAPEVAQVEEERPFHSPPTPQSLAPRRFLYWGNARMTPRGSAWVRARMVAVTGCTLAGLACCLMIAALLRL